MPKHNKEGIQVVVTNDCKEKYQSWEAIIDEQDGWRMAHFTVGATGYGATRKEAVIELKNALMNLRGLMNDIIDNY